MPTKSKFVLPESFLEAARAAAASPLYFESKRRGLVRIPFVGGAEDNGEGGEGGSEGDQGDRSGSGADGGSGSGESGGDGEDSEGAGDGDEDEMSGLPDNVKEILRKNRAATRKAEQAKAAAETAAAEATAKVKEYADRDKSELEKAQERAATAEQTAADEKAKGQRLALRGAFLASDKYTWVNPEDALDMALLRFDLGSLEVDADGRVDRKKLDAILKRMADEKTYLVKKEDDEGAGKGASGGSFNGGKSNAKAKNEGALAARYPAMAGRRKVQE
jgi:hypothetical protein